MPKLSTLSPFARTASLGLVLLAATLCPSPRAHATPPTVRVDTDVREQYYDVYGTNADEIFASIQRQRLGGEAGLSASGLTESELSFNLSTTIRADTCRLSTVSLRADVTVSLPRHARPDTLDPDTRRQWQAYEALVEFHEYRHVEFEFQGVHELEARLERETVEAPGASAAACNAYVERAIQEQTALTRSRHEQFHVEETAAVRNAQAALLAQMNVIDDELTRDKAEMDRLEVALGAREAERSDYARAVEELTRAYGNTLPSPHYEQARDLGASIDALTEEMNEIVNARNALVDSYNARIDERADLAERLAWTR